MGIEIEHKYKVKDDSFKSLASEMQAISQGYLSRVPERTVRVRKMGNRGYLTVKGKNHGDARLEFEYEIPAEDAEKLLGLCEPPLLEKNRYIVFYEGKKWEVDEYLGQLKGLVLAEIELDYPDEPYSLPEFVGQNVTGDPSYYNSNLINKNM